MSPISNILSVILLLCCSEYGTALTTPSSSQQQQQDSRSAFGRRNFLQTAVALGSAATVGFNPLAAHAEFGTDAKMSFPDVLQGMNDRATKQCLVESLGNRECLVYMEDAEKFLYKGVDVSTLVERIQVTTKALEKIPPLVESKQWNAINGVLTGPLGQLSYTLTQITGVASNPKLAKDKAQIVKNDLFAMGTANTNKNGDEVLKYQQKAIEDLAVFLKSL